MANKKLSEGVGKKIVEALKKQSEIEINPTQATNDENELEIFDEIVENYEEEALEPQESYQDESFLDDLQSENFSESLKTNEDLLL